MKIYDVPMTDLERFARDIGVTFEGTDESNSAGTRVRGRLIPDRSTPLGSRSYQRLSAAIMFHEGRRVNAVCWHGHRDFMAKVFTRYPDARIQTAFADYRGISDFDAKYVDTGLRNIGAPIAPVSMWSACQCCEQYSYGPPLEISDSDYENALSLAKGDAVIDESTARRIASEWHSGQWTDLYAFTSSGHIAETLEMEVERLRDSVTEPHNRNELSALLRYVRDNQIRAREDCFGLDTV